MVRSTSLDGPIANIPYEAIQAFLGRPGLLSRDDVRNAPYVVGMRDRHIAAGTDMQVYVKGLDRAAAGRYSIIHAGQELKDPDSGAVAQHGTDHDSGSVRQMLAVVDDDDGLTIT